MNCVSRVHNCKPTFSPPCICNNNYEWTKMISNKKQRRKKEQERIKSIHFDDIPNSMLNYKRKLQEKYIKLNHFYEV